MRKGTQLTLEEPNGVSEPLSCLSKALEQHCEMSLKCLAPFCTHLPVRQAISLVCPAQKELCQQESSIYLQNPCKLSSGLSLVAGLMQKFFFKAWKNTTLLCIFFFSTLSFSFRGKIFLAQLFAHLIPISKHLVLYNVSILFPCDVLD